METIRDDKIEKTKAILQLMSELDKGRRSGEEKCFVSASEVRARFNNRKELFRKKYSKD